MAHSSSLSRLKGLRTRYRNLLKREMERLPELQSMETDQDSLSKHIKQVSALKYKITDFYSKFEDASEKLSSMLDESDLKAGQIDLEKEESELTIFSGEVTGCLAELCVLEKELVEKRQVNTSGQTGLEHHLERLAEMQTQLQMQTQQLITSQQIQLAQMQGTNSSGNRTSSVKLPKLEMKTFNGNILHWKEFWDSFEATVHNNSTLSSVEKLTYLKSMLSGAALTTISGLSVCNQNYEVALDLLTERYGDQQAAINLHYVELIDLPACANTTSKLRQFYDNLERHFRALDANGQDIEQQVLISMITSKLPKDVLLQLELQKGIKTQWTVQQLRHLLKENIMARESAERHTAQSSTFDSKGKEIRKSFAGDSASNFPMKSSAEALVASSKQTLNKQPETGCRFCGKNHWSDECVTYSTLTDRKQQIKGHCYICLRKGHSFKDCKVDKPCYHCNQRKNHHRCLCPKKLSKTSEPAILVEEKNKHSESAMVASGEIVLMQTATTNVRNPLTNDTENVRLLLDSGSHRTYITEKLAKQLQLKVGKEKEEISLVTFGSENPQIIKTPIVSIEINLKDGTFLTLQANVVPKITGVIHRMPVNLENCDSWKYLWKDISLADTLPTETEASSLDLLIGNDYYLDIVLPEKIQLFPGLYLLGSRLGWIISGRTTAVNETKTEISMLVLTFGNHFMCESARYTQPDKPLPVNPPLEEFWSLETIGIRDQCENVCDETARKTFNETVQKSNGRYYVTWPWKESVLELPDNKELAFQRLKSLVHRLKKFPELLIKYDRVLTEQEEKHIIEKVTETDTDSKVHYIPHHAVINLNRPTTKIRIVYDASAKTKKCQPSLNDCLYRGPVILQDLCGLLLRFRTHPVALIADIEKAFLQVGLQKSERDVTRFFWLKDPYSAVTRENIQVFRFQRVPFGVVSSPFLLGATILFHLKTVGTPIAEKISQNLYVDNVISGCQSLSEAQTFYLQSKKIFADASMNLREWTSNSTDLLDQLQPYDRCDKKEQKVLGIRWDMDKDELYVPAPPEKACDEILTKRNVLRVIASVFDPLGLVSPITLKAKLFLQNLWKDGVKWDDELSETKCDEWNVINHELQSITELKVPRCVAPVTSTHTTYQLLCFCDASMQAYCAAVYLRLTNDKSSELQLVFAKCRLSPLKQISIPKLELMAALIGVRCLNFVRDHIQLPIQDRFLWTDSQCVLYWIESNRPLSVFVENRLNEIRSQSDIQHRYVPTDENPADVATRGRYNSQLHSKLWLQGPKWCSQHPDTWPAWNTTSDEQKANISIEPELYVAADTKSKCLPDNSTPLGIDITRFSSLTKLIRVTAICLKFLEKLKRPPTSEILTPEDLNKAKLLWEKHVQSAHYSDVISSLSHGKTNNIARQLGIQIDNDGLLRCHGRLQNAELTHGAKIPKLLPRKDPFTRLVIYHCHSKILHSGSAQTLVAVRQEYWIPRGRTAVREVTRHCAICRKHEGGHFKMPPMPPYPAQRVSKSVPFTYTGLDYLGPIFVKNNTERRKVWVCLFTCLATRAVHLEIINDMSTEEFLMCFRRFSARYGKPKQVISDNAPQFKLAKSVLEQLWQNIVHADDILTYMGKENITWKFITEFAPWMGGFYERLVSLVKRCLRKAIGRICLTYVQLETLLKEVECVINSRPLVYVDDDIDSHETLTPNHFLVQNLELGVPTLGDASDPDYLPFPTSADKLIQVWKKGQAHLERFWQIWRDDYLLSLRERFQTHLKGNRIQEHSVPKIGDVVLIKENLPRAAWKIGRITDGEIRTARILLPSKSEISRPFNLLYPIECDISTSTSSKVDTGNSSCEMPQPKLRRSERLANKI